MSPPAARGRRPDVTGVELVDGVEKRDLVLVDPDRLWPDTWLDTNAYADAKTAVITQTKERARGAPIHE